MTFAAGDDNMPCNSTSQSREVFGQPLLGAFAVPRDTRKTAQDMANYGNSPVNIMLSCNKVVVPDNILYVMNIQSICNNMYIDCTINIYVCIM